MITGNQVYLLVQVQPAKVWGLTPFILSMCFFLLYPQAISSNSYSDAIYSVFSAVSNGEMTKMYKRMCVGYMQIVI